MGDIMKYVIFSLIVLVASHTFAFECESVKGKYTQASLEATSDEEIYELFIKIKGAKTQTYSGTLEYMGCLDRDGSDESPCQELHYAFKINEPEVDLSVRYVLTNNGLNYLFIKNKKWESKLLCE